MLYNFLKVIVRGIIYPLFRVEIHGKENIPSQGDFVLCGNHWSNWDPVLLAGALDSPIYFMAKKELFTFKPLAKFLSTLHAFPVDREKMDLKSLRHAVSLIDEGKILGIFPEGKRVYSMDRSNMKDGAGYVALKARVDVVPVEIISQYKLFRKTHIYIKKPLMIEDYSKYKRKEGMERLMDDTFKAIYEHRVALNSANNEK